MTNAAMAFEIAKRFLELENDNRVMRVVLSRYWNHQVPWKDFVQKGVQQLQDRETRDRGSKYLELAFDPSNEDASLLQTLYGETVGRVEIPK